MIAPLRMATQALRRPLILVAALLLAASSPFGANCQLPDDIQRELNQNLAEQARIQALQARQQQLQQQQARPGLRSSPAAAAAVGAAPASGGSPAAKHDPNNYSYQQVSPPVQYSYYQPFGDAAATPATQPQQASRRQSSIGQAQPVNIDLNNLDLDNLNLPQPQAQVSSAAAQPRNHHHPQQQRQHYTPSFTGVGGLPVLKPIAASGNSFESAVPQGAAPLAPQARVQQGPPLTEADFKDITGGENYGAPGGNDFGLGDATSSASGQPQSRASDSTDAQLREFGLPAEPQQRQQPAAHNNRRLDNAGGMSIPDFGGFNPIGAGAGQQQQQMPRADSGNDFADFGNLASETGNGGMPDSGQNNGGPQSNGAEFDFAGQPSSRQSGVDPATTGPMNGGAPGSLQSLLGATFPGLGGSGGPGNSGLDDFARSSNNPQATNQRQDDGAMDMADMGDKSDGFSGADLGAFEQPTPKNDQDFNYGAASNQQPKSVSYPDGGPQAVGTLWALTQPQSLTQTRYSALPDKGTFHDYPAYASGGNDFGAVASVVDETRAARPPAPGRYGTPTPQALAHEVRESVGAGQQYNYGREPASVWQRHQQQQQQNEAGSDRASEFDFPFE